MKKQLSIIILNRNTKDLLKQCLESLPENYQVIVVDNASTDDSVAMVKKNFPKTELILNEENIGFTRGNNAARNTVAGKYILFLNSDTKVFPNTIETMLALMESDDKIGIATCAVDLPSGKPYYASHRGFPTPLNSLLYFVGLPSSYYPKYQPKIHEIDACSGAFLLIRHDILNQVNWFDEDFFAYGEDLDICFKVKQLGYKVVFNPHIKIIHYWGASSGLKSTSKNVTTAENNNSNRWNDARYQAMKIFYDKHYRQKYTEFFRWFIFNAIDAANYLRRGKD